MSAADSMPGDDMSQADFEDALERVSESDRKWFEATPGRQFRLRPIDPATEIAPGDVYYPGARTVVAQIQEGFRMRWPFRRVHEALREDSDENAAVLLSHYFFTRSDGTATTALQHVREARRAMEEESRGPTEC
jgi:hypothetical protein